MESLSFEFDPSILAKIENIEHNFEKEKCYQEFEDVVDESPTSEKNCSKEQFWRSNVRRGDLKKIKYDSLLENQTNVQSKYDHDVKQGEMSELFKSSLNVEDLVISENPIIARIRRNSRSDSEIEKKRNCASITYERDLYDLEDIFEETFEFDDQVNRSPNSDHIWTPRNLKVPISSTINIEKGNYSSDNKCSQHIEASKSSTWNTQKFKYSSHESLLPNKVKSPVDSSSDHQMSSDIEKFLEDDLDIFINVEETSFTFGISEIVDQECNSTQKSSLLPPKEKLIAVIKAEEMNMNESIKVSCQLKQMDVIRDLSKCSEGILNWSETECIESDNSLKSTLQEASNVVNNLAGNIETCKDISRWNLPTTVVEEYKNKGIHQMFDWQVECLNNAKILLENVNLVYSAPTSAGKTLVSEILTIKTIVERKKKCIIILPFISVVREKIGYLQDLLTSSGYRVDGFFGGYNPPGGFENLNVAVCTIEKANSIVNKLLEQNKLAEIGLIVVDEIHLISDPGRGYIIELLLAKIMYMCLKFSMSIQVVTMSATLENIKLLRQWLRAEFYATHFRPVELQEMMKIGPKIYNNKMELVRELSELETISKDQDHIAQLCIETMLMDCSVIVFCPSKDWCESLCQNLSKSIYYIIKARSLLGEEIFSRIRASEIEEIKLQLKNCPAGLDIILAKTLPYACAFHHAGLTIEERDIIEASFKSGLTKILVATSTLSSGVNMPARRVLIRTPNFAGKKMNSLTYKQMIGRAGRTGKDTLGESILICTETNIKNGKELVCSALPPLQSCLGLESGMPLKRALLEVIASGVVSTKNDVDEFLQCTLFHAQKSHNTEYNEETVKNLHSKYQSPGSDNDPILESIQFLTEYEFVRLQTNEETSENHYLPTRLGMACLASSLPPNDGLLLFSELQKSRRCFVLETELHAVYLVTPYSVCSQINDIDWLQFLDMFDKLAPALKRVGEIIGVKESFFIKAMHGNKKLDYRALQVHKRFYVALALQELINEVPLAAVSAKYKCSRGLLQSLQQMSSTFAGIVASFCTTLNWTMLAVIVSEFKERLFFGVHRDLIDLMQLPDLNAHKARVLFNAGITSLIDLANSDCFTLEKILFNSVSFDIEGKHEDEDEYETNKRNALRCLHITGKTGMTIKNAAILLISNTRRFLQYQIGVKNVQWTNRECIKVVDGNPRKKVDQSQGNSDARANSPEESVDAVHMNKDELHIKMKGNNSKHLTNKRESETKSPLKTIQMENLNDGIIIQTEKTSQPLRRLNVDLKTEIVRLMSCEKADMDSSYNRSVDEITNSQSSRTATPRPFRNMSTGRVTRSRLMQSKLSDLNQQKIEICRKKSTDIKTQLSSDTSFEIFDDYFSFHFNSSHILNISKNESNSASFQNISIVNMCGDGTLYRKCMNDIFTAKQVGLSVSVQRLINKRRALIGSNLLINKIKNNNECEEGNATFIFDDILYLTGLSFCIADNVVFYLNLQNSKGESKIDQKTLIDDILNIFSNNKLKLRMFDAKEQLKVLKKCIPLLTNIEAQLEDPKIVSWLLQSDKELTLGKITQRYSPECSALMSLAGVNSSYHSFGLSYSSAILGKVRSAVEACISLHVLESQIEHLSRVPNITLSKFFYELEMPVQLILWQMEMVGFPVNVSLLRDLSKLIIDVSKKLEKKIYEMHGSSFKLSSTSAVARVLGLHKRSNGKLSTAKQILEKIDSPLSNMILVYRKLDATLHKSIQPIIQCIQNDRSSRIRSTSISFTATGRISMTEPNLQNVAKDFVVEISDKEKYSISCRSAFTCDKDKLLISIDFCQLEMRILTHLSQDKALVKIMHSEEDIFRAIAAKWNKLSQADVSENLRNGTKQICYGIIYGMGVRSLAESLKCDIEEAEILLEQFHREYPSIRAFTNKILEFAKENGYVETITGRRRHLPHIHSTEETIRSQAERQALNTTIQGSAADIAKKAIVRIDHNLQKYASRMEIHSHDIHFILHVHDEFIFETTESQLNNVVKIIKASMENSAQLNVPLRVKVRVGISWGSLEEI